jgi:hypothetical protein
LVVPDPGTYWLSLKQEEKTIALSVLNQDHMTKQYFIFGLAQFPSSRATAMGAL